jgi:hypothetical protein
LNGLSFILIDTPGFDDTYHDDAAILSKLASFMASTYQQGTQLTAIIYVHPIHHERFEGSARDNLHMFQKLCGDDFYPNVVLATNFWTCVDADTGARREAELRDKPEFWGDMVQQGSWVVRLPDEREAAVELLMELAWQKRRLLRIQREIVDQGRDVMDTDAAASTARLRALKAAEEEYNRQAEVMQRGLDHTRRIWEEKARKKTERRVANAAARFAEQKRRQEKESARVFIELDLHRQRGEEEEKARKAEVEHERQREAEEQRQLARRQTAFEKLGRNRADREEIIDAVMGALRRGFEYWRIRANLSLEFWNLKIPICDACYHGCSVQLSYCKYSRLPFLTWLTFQKSVHFAGTS